MNRRFVVILIALVIAALVYFSPSLNANENVYIGPAWEYAEMVYFPDMKNAFVSSTNSAEYETLLGLFTEAGTATAPDQIGTILYLRIMGDRGWELTTRETMGTLIQFTFKRAK